MNEKDLCSTFGLANLHLFIHKNHLKPDIQFILNMTKADLNPSCTSKSAHRYNSHIYLHANITNMQKNRMHKCIEDLSKTNPFRRDLCFVHVSCAFSPTSILLLSKRRFKATDLFVWVVEKYCVVHPSPEPQSLDPLLLTLG